MLRLKHPAVVILGAGATRGAFSSSELPPPVDKDFFEIASQIQGRGTPEIARKVLRSVWELYGRTHTVGLEEYYREVETRARIGAFAKTRNQPKDWNRRRRDLEELIRRVFIHTTVKLRKNKFEPLISQLHQVVLRQLRPGDTIITFNYDMVVEEAIQDSFPWHPKNGYGIRVAGISHEWAKKWQNQHPESIETKIELLKLHGSLSWRQYSNHQICLKSRPYTVRSGYFDKTSVLAPGWNKPIDRVPYKNFWRNARLKLEDCQSLIIIGYSLPETDLLARALFSEIVRTRASRKEYLSHLLLVDKSDDVKTKFADMFTPSLGPSGRISRYTSFEQFGRVLEPRRRIR